MHDIGACSTVISVARKPPKYESNCVRKYWASMVGLAGVAEKFVRSFYK